MDDLCHRSSKCTNSSAKGSKWGTASAVDANPLTRSDLAPLDEASVEDSAAHRREDIHFPEELVWFGTDTLLRDRGIEQDSEVAQLTGLRKRLGVLALKRAHTTRKTR